ncbi:lytic murein transglycosylase, partial [Salmonella enterica subsp. enterica serovar Virginia]|nr:lytic murein transglycosylase [Salmonella enterica subsp. enterica serovar Virginia]
RQFAPDVAFGWQTNVWATGTADWVLRDTADPVAEGQAIAGFILDALATLSFNYPRRAEYFSGELETFLLMARDEQDDPLNLKG